MPCPIWLRQLRPQNRSTSMKRLLQLQERPPSTIPRWTIRKWDMPKQATTLPQQASMQGMAR